ncbi:MAG: hypothetical protein IID34_18170 [Planctomycetes bacterium]|nr:hypothetical protein [Planctomycetota bacterium]
MKPSEAEKEKIMRIRATFVTKVAGSIMAIGLSPFLMGGGCGPNPEDLAGIAAVYNATDDQLTVVAHGKTEDVTVVLEAGEAVFFEVRQNVESYRFDFMQGSLSGLGGLTLATGGELPDFATGLLTVSRVESAEELTVDRTSNTFSFGGSGLGSFLGSLVPSKAVFFLVNDGAATLGLGGPGGGLLMRPGDSASVLIDQGETITLEIRDFSEEGELEISHTFAPPMSPVGDVSAFLTLVRVGAEGIEVQTREAKFGRLQ